MSARDKMTRMTILGLSVLGFAVAGCEEKKQVAPPARTPEVAVVTVAEESLVLTTELPGRTAAFLVAEVRPQVTGIIQSRLFEEGRDVKEGDVLYQIDPARYEATLARAQASLAMAEADIPALQSRVDRYKSAVADRAVSQQAYDEALAALNQAKATVDARKADVESARIDLEYTRITAPISGRIGRSTVTVGSLATANQPQALATIHCFNSVYVDVAQSSAELLRLRREMESGGLRVNGESQKKVRLLLEDGTPYAQEGALQFRDIAVDPTTGSYTLRIVFPNPDHVLLPGMFVRAVVQDGIVEKAILAPQQGVSRTPKGEPAALVVDANNTVQQRLLTLDRAIGSKWLVESGLSAGDRLIVEGLLNVQPGVAVNVVPFDDGAGRAESQSVSQPVAQN